MKAAVIASLLAAAAVFAHAGKGPPATQGRPCASPRECGGLACLPRAGGGASCEIPCGANQPCPEDQRCVTDLGRKVCRPTADLTL